MSKPIGIVLFFFKKYKIFLLSVLFLCFPIRDCFSQNKISVSLAIIPTQSTLAPEEVVTARLEENISHSKGMRLVERTQIKKILEELQIGASGMMDSKNVPRLGQLLSADILLFMGKVPDIVPVTYRIQIIESESGIILNTTLDSEEVLLKDIDSVMSVVTAAIDKHYVPMNARHFVGILGFKSEEPGSSLDGTAEALRMFLEVDLAATPHVVMLDREHLNHLQTEKVLTGLELKLKNSAILLDAGIKYASGQKDGIITLFLKSMTGGVEKFISMNVPLDNMALTRKILMENIFTKLNIDAATNKAIDPDKEAKLFLAKVPFFLSSGDYQIAVRYAEVAYTLSPNQETRYWAARAWYALGWTLAKTVQAQDFGITLTRPTRATQDIFGTVQRNAIGKVENTRRVTQSENGHEFWGTPQKKQDGKSNRTTKIYTTNQKNSMSKKQALSAFIRAYTLIYELSRFHIQEYKIGGKQNLEIPDPTKFPKSPAIESYTTAKIPLSSNDADSNEIKKMHIQLTDMRNDIISFQQEFYTHHYASIDKGDSFYWDTWRKKKEIISHDYKHSPTQRISLIRQAVNA
ncbi:hypothetical protein MNBD_UNCLBAC01-1204 [hydrothermal vent metagenome]|uniref:Uncharacterized protein n=1 Tax=hydrothermal vent metagenome TaxID=652676 RepID=A0A3B1DCT4_9ZZZZ